ncbi:hypothetical protein D3C83_60110 [compost metagenome]
MYGTWVICVPDSEQSSSIPRCSTAPTPEDAYVTLPGWDFASASRSFTDDTGSEGVTSTTYELLVSLVTGWKSLIGS